jgi:DNA-binding response OmpR family regulator
MTRSRRVLIVDDDKGVREALEALFRREGYETRTLGGGRGVEAEAERFRPDAVILDLNMPDRSGLDVCRGLREGPATSRVPILLLTARAAEGDKVLGLRTGADDYVTKPFGAFELAARVEALLRRAAPGGPSDAPVDAGGVRVDPRTHTAEVRGRSLKLRPKEFSLLYLLAARAGSAVPRRALVEALSDYGPDAASRSLDSQIKNLRKALGAQADRIETVPKFGYRLRKD